MRSKAMLFCALLSSVAIAMVAGCNRNATVEDFSAALVELRDEGTISWNVGADGTIKAMVKTRDEKPVTSNVSGKVSTGDAAVELTQVEGSGVLEGKGLKLTGDMTRARYDLVVEGKPWSGTLFLPATGTAAFAAGAKAAANVKLPEPKIGPHGGTLQVVGGDVVEIVANVSSGELRVYAFDAQLKAVAAADREIKVGLVTDSKAELVALVPEPGGAYFTGKAGINVDPVEIAISVKAKGQAEAQCAIVGFQPGVALAIGSTAPRVKILVKAEAPLPEAEVNARADLKGAAGVGANLKTGLDVKAPDVKLKGAITTAPVPAAAGAGAGASAAAGASAVAGAKAGLGVSAGISGGVNGGAKAGADTKAAADGKAAASDGKAVKTGGKLQVKLP